MFHVSRERKKKWQEVTREILTRYFLEREGGREGGSGDISHSTCCPYVTGKQ